jgi:plasmid stabilization system protein ParE
MSVTIKPEQRDALYDRLLDQLSGFDDVTDAVEQSDFEAAQRYGRRISDALRMIIDGLGWGPHASDDVELKIPPNELERIVTNIRDDAVTQYEAEQHEQEEFRRTWERTALVRDTCTEVLEQLRGQ